MNAGRINDIRLLGMISLLLIVGLAIVGMSWMTRVQYLLLVTFLLRTISSLIIRGSVSVLTWLGLGWLLLYKHTVESPRKWVLNESETFIKMEP